MRALKSLPDILTKWVETEKAAWRERGSTKEGSGSNQTPQYIKLRFLVVIYGYKCIKTAIIRNHVWPAMESNFSGKEQRSLQSDCQYKQEIFLLFNMLLCMRAVWSYFWTKLLPYSFINIDYKVFD